jgi:hypothetical protein
MERKKSKVFLGGTCNDSTWRDELIPHLNVDYFNPVVEDWTPECKEVEEVEKNEKCDVHVYVITSQMIGVYSIAEAVESAANKDKILIFAVVEPGFTELQVDSLYATGALLARVDRYCSTLYFHNYFNPKDLSDAIDCAINFHYKIN